MQAQDNFHLSDASLVVSLEGSVVNVGQFSQGGRLRVNMGNIYYEQQKYSQAIKMYRMALDQTSNAYKDTRYKIARNIGNAFMKLGQYQVTAALSAMMSLLLHLHALALAFLTLQFLCHGFVLSRSILPIAIRTLYNLTKLVWGSRLITRQATT